MTNEPDRPGTQADATRAGEGLGALDPGRVSAFLAELARAPDRDPEAALRALRPGAVVGRFELVREIGRGGFGVVFEAVDRELSRRVAFKAIRPGRRAAASPGAAAPEDAWLRREAESAAQLAHPNIVTLHDVGTSEDGPYLVLELLRGETVAERLRRGPLGPREAVRISVEVARALAHAHAAGVLHRDLKPQNVFLCDDGAVKVLDFGLAHVLGTATRRGGGTPGYMAPEQWRGEEEDERTDFFAAAVLLHEMLSGELPYPMVSGRSAALEPGPAPVLRRPGVPRALSSLVAAGLSKDPAGRPRNAQIWLDGLFAAERALARPRSRRERVLLAGAAVLAAAALAGGAFWMLGPWPGAVERVSVSVADFANDTDERDLSGLSGMLVTSLEQSRRLSVMTRSRMFDVLKQLGRDPVERIDEPLAREIGRRSGVRALLLASIRRFDRVYSIELRALDPARDEYLFTLREESEGKASIPAMIDRLSERTRRALRERPPEIRGSEVKVAEVTTSNLEAYQHYFQGEQLLLRGSESINATDWAQAREEFRRAVAIDPAFAMAHYRIAYTLRYERRDAGDNIAAAMRHLSRAAPKDRSYILALDARIAGRTSEAVRRYEEILRSYPDEKEAHLDLAQLAASREGGRDTPAAIRHARKALELAPTFAMAWEELLSYERWRGDLEGLLEDATRYARLVPGVSSYTWLGHAQLATGRRVEAEQTFRREAEVMTSSPAGFLGLATLRFVAGDLAAAEGEYRRLAESREPDWAREGQYGLSWVSAYRGRYREAARRLDEVIRADEVRKDAADLTRAWGQKALWLTLVSGRLAEDAIRRGLHPPVEPAIINRHFYWFAIQAALSAGRLDRAVELQRRGANLGSNHTDQLLRMVQARAAGRTDEALAISRDVADPRDVTYGFHLSLAEWALADGRLDDALARADGALALPVWPHPDVVGYRAWAHPRALLLRAKIHEARGERTAALSDLDALLALWKDADTDAPETREAWSRRKRLAR